MSNPYRVDEDGLGIHVMRHYDDGDVLYWAQAKPRSEADTIAAAEWGRELADGIVP